jgi:hypothetical protein
MLPWQRKETSTSQSVDRYRDLFSSERSIHWFKKKKTITKKEFYFLFDGVFLFVCAVLDADWTDELGFVVPITGRFVGLGSFDLFNAFNESK